MTERRKQTKGKMCATYARTRKGKELEKELILHVMFLEGNKKYH
jgi:hypothetical protein